FTGKWKQKDKLAVVTGVILTGTMLAKETPTASGANAFTSVFETINFMWMDQTCDINGYTCYADAYQPGTIRVWSSYYATDPNGNTVTKSTPVTSQLIVHELGHKFNVAAGRRPESYVANY